MVRFPFIYYVQPLVLLEYLKACTFTVDTVEFDRSRGNPQFEGMRQLLGGALPIRGLTLRYPADRGTFQASLARQPLCVGRGSSTPCTSIVSPSQAGTVRAR